MWWIEARNNYRQRRYKIKNNNDSRLTYKPNYIAHYVKNNETKYLTFNNNL